MKLFTVAALICLVAMSIIVLSSCSTVTITPPTPFITGEEVRPMGGCLDLRQQVDEWNKKNPTSTKKADC
jgi:hypothetical protein